MNIILPEIVAAGIYSTEIATKNKTVTKPRKTTMFEIEIPIENGGTSYINEEKQNIKTNMIICAKPGQLRHTKLPFKCKYIHIIIRNGKLYEELMKMPNYIITNKHNEYLTVFERICKHFDSAVETDEIIVNGLILELIYMLIRECERLTVKNNIKSNNYEAIEKSIKYIKENLTSDLSLDTLAKNAGFSPIHFHNCFKASTGRTLQKYVEEQRIRKAANLLITTTKTLTEIAYECGFSSQSYFSYAFRRKMDMSPRQYADKIFKRYYCNSD